MADQFRWEGVDVPTAARSFRFAVGRVAALGRMRMMSKFGFVWTGRLPMTHGQIQILNVGPNVCRFFIWLGKLAVASVIYIFVKRSHERLLFEQTDRVL